MVKLQIKFGIKIHRGISNKANMKWYRKIDTYNYLKTISDSYEDIDTEICNFREEAKKISEMDADVFSCVEKTEYFLVCYIEMNGIITTKTIKQLFYEF